MQLTQVSVNDLRNNLAEYLGQVHFAGKWIEVKKYDETYAYLVSAKEMAQLLQLRSLTPLSDEDRVAHVKSLQSILDGVPKNDPDEVKAVVDSEIYQARAENHIKAAQT